MVQLVMGGNRFAYFSLPVSKIVLGTCSLPMFATIFCVVWSVAFDFERSTATHCKVVFQYRYLSIIIIHLSVSENKFWQFMFSGIQLFTFNQFCHWRFRTPALRLENMCFDPLYTAVHGWRSLLQFSYICISWSNQQEIQGTCCPEQSVASGRNIQSSLSQYDFIYRKWR